MSGVVAAADGQLDPSAVLINAIDRLRADGHAELAAAVERVDAYLRELAVAHTEIVLASDRALKRGDALLSPDAALPAVSDRPDRGAQSDQRHP